MHSSDMWSAVSHGNDDTKLIEVKEVHLWCNTGGYQVMKHQTTKMQNTTNSSIYVRIRVEALAQ